MVWEIFMEVIKKNMVSVICGAVAIIAVIAAFYPLNGKFEQVRADGELRAKVSNDLAAMMKKSREWPKVDPNAPKADPLTQFPSDDINKLGQKRKEEIERDSREMFLHALEYNRHQ